MAGYTIIPNEFFILLSGDAIKLYQRIVVLSLRDGVFYESLANTAKGLKLSENKIRKLKKELQTHRVIVVFKRPMNGKKDLTDVIKIIYQPSPVFNRVQNLHP